MNFQLIISSVPVTVAYGTETTFSISGMEESNSDINGLENRTPVEIGMKSFSEMLDTYLDLPESGQDLHNESDCGTNTNTTETSSKRRCTQTFDFKRYTGIIKKFRPENGVGYRVRCEICYKYSDIVKKHSISRKSAQIVSEAGTGNRTDVLSAHLSTPYHRECMKRHERGDDGEGEESVSGCNCKCNSGGTENYC